MTSLNNDGANNQEENGENRQNNNNNYQNLIRNHLQQIQTIHQETNSHFEDIMRRISSIRNMQNNLNINDNNQPEISNLSVNDLLTMNYCLFIIPLIIVALSFLVGYEVIKFKRQSENDLLEINAKILESSSMWSFYFLFSVLIFFIFWFIFLFIHKIATNFDNHFFYSEQKFTIEDILLFNPCYNNVVFLYYNKSFLSTNFDFIVLVIFLYFISLNFIFCYYTHLFFIHKIAQIQSKKCTNIGTKIHMYYISMISLNFISFLMMFWLIPVNECFGPFIFIVMKNFYLFLHQIKLYHDNILSYNQIDFSYANNEKNFIYNQYNILIIHYVIHITFMCQMIFSAYIFYIKNSIFLFLPIVMIIFKSLNALTIITLKLTALYKLIKNVDKK